MLQQGPLHELGGTGGHGAPWLRHGPLRELGGPADAARRGYGTGRGLTAEPTATVRPTR